MLLRLRKLLIYDYFCNLIWIINNLRIFINLTVSKKLVYLEEKKITQKHNITIVYDEVLMEIYRRISEQTLTNRRDGAHP